MIRLISSGIRRSKRAQARLDMGDRDAQLGRRERAREGRVRVAVDEDRVRSRVDEDRLESGQHRRRLLGVRPAADPQRVVRSGQTRARRRRRRPSPRRSAGRCRRRSRRGRPQDGRQGGGLDELGPRPDDTDDAHRLSVPREEGPRRSGAAAADAAVGHAAPGRARSRSELRPSSDEPKRREPGGLERPPGGSAVWVTIGLDAGVDRRPSPRRRAGRARSRRSVSSGS